MLATQGGSQTFNMWACGRHIAFKPQHWPTQDDFSTAFHVVLETLSTATLLICSRGKGKETNLEAKRPMLDSSDINPLSSFVLPKLQDKCQT